MFKIPVLTVIEEIYKMQRLEGSGTPVLYIGRTVLKGLMGVRLRANSLFTANLSLRL